MDLFEEWKQSEPAPHIAKGGEVVVEDEPPLFSLRRLDWSLKIPSSRSKTRAYRNICKVVVNNNVFVLGTTDGFVLRWNIESGGEAEEIDISKKTEDIIYNIFMDPTANHVIISCKNGDAYYLHSRSNKPKKLSKLNGNIESVAFDRLKGTEANTKSFLIGTSTGRIFELFLESSGKEKICQLVHQLEQPHPITSLHFESYTSHGSAASSAVGSGGDEDGGEGPSNRIFVLCVTSTPTRLYHFIGGPTFQQLFIDYKNSGSSTFAELPGSIDNAELHCFSKYHNEANHSFAMTTQLGVYHGSILLPNSTSQASAENVVMEAGLVPFAMPQNTPSPMQPLSLAVTEFHYLLLYPHALVSQSRISGAVQHEDNLLLLLSSGAGIGDDVGDPVSLVRDAVRQTMWMITTTSIYQITAAMEDRTVWSIYLAKAIDTADGRLFETAHQYCKKEEHRRAVHRAQAMYNLQRGNTEKAATHFAVTNIPFEEVALMLLSYRTGQASSKKQQMQQQQPQLESTLFTATHDLDLSSEANLTSLRVYLQEKLRILPVGTKSQRTMIATWLCEVYLHLIATGGGVADSKLLRQFKDFLRNNRGTLDITTTISLLTSRGQSFRPLLLFYCQIVGDYDRVLSHYVSEGLYGDAITVLQNSPIEKVGDLICKKAPVLMEHLPEMAVELFLSRPLLRPKKLLPALFRYAEVLDRQTAVLENRRLAMSHKKGSGGSDPLQAGKAHHTSSDEILSLDEDSYGNKKNFAIYYLEETLHRACVQVGEIVVDASVQHALIWFLAKYDDDSERGLLALLQPLVDTDGIYGEDGVVIDRDIFDPGLALRTCRRLHRKRSCVYLYVLMNLYEKAVALALEVSVEFAKAIASRPVEYAVAKKLWLAIAKHVIISAGESDIGRVLDVLRDSNGVLRIENILEYLPDFTEIDHFKDEIYATLEEYATRVEGMKEEMEELSNSAEAIETELVAVTTRGFGVKTSQPCECCSNGLFGRQFYLFPCGHGFHEDCLLLHSAEYLDGESEVQAVSALQEQIKQVASRAKDNDKRSLTQLDQLQNELDSYVAADCPLCGNYMIRSIGMSLTGSEKEQLEAKTWAL